jgi:hypothetical protein
MQVGIDSFAAAFDDSSRAVSPSDRLRQLVERTASGSRVPSRCLVPPTRFACFRASRRSICCHKEGRR